MAGGTTTITVTLHDRSAAAFAEAALLVGRALAQLALERLMFKLSHVVAARRQT